MAVSAPLGAQQRPRPLAPPAPHYAPSLAGPAVASTVAAGASLLLIPMDLEVRQHALGPGIQHSGAIRGVDRAFRWVGGDLPTAGAGAVWLTGLAIGNDGTEDFGLHVGEALLAATLASSLAQRVVGRSRPFLDPHDPSAFSFAAGFGSRDHRSFPSGHATSAFALATGLTVEAKEAWGDEALYVAVPAVAVATITALSRVVDDQHWLSDVVAGAGLGTLVSVLVMRANGH